MTDDRPLFELVAHEMPDGVLIQMSGELDLSSAGSTDIVLSYLGLPAQTLTLDLAGLGFCDSMGLQSLVRIRAAAVGAGWRFRVVNVQPHIRRIFDITGLTEHLNVIDGRPPPS